MQLTMSVCRNNGMNVCSSSPQTCSWALQFTPITRRTYLQRNNVSHWYPIYTKEIYK